jgi:hypothetical protein
MAEPQDSSEPTRLTTKKLKGAPSFLRIPPPSPPSIIVMSPNPFPSTEGVFSEPQPTPEKRRIRDIVRFWRE